jgi:hypothetical protein
MYHSSTRVWACAADSLLCGVDSGRGSTTGATAGGVVGATVPIVVEVAGVQAQAQELWTRRVGKYESELQLNY